MPTTPFPGDIAFHTHGQLGWRKPAGFGFARAIAVQPLAADEIGRVAQSIPVAFRQAQGRWQAVAVLGPARGANLHVAHDGRWRAGFVPAALRVYPFRLTERGALALWEGHAPQPAAAEGVEPFFPEGRLNGTLARTRAFLARLRTRIDATHAPLAFLDSRGVLAPWQVPGIDAPDPGAALDDLWCLDRAGFEALRNADWLALRQAGAVGWLYAHLDSLHHAARFRALADTLVRPEPGPPQASDPTEGVAAFLSLLSQDIEKEGR